MKKLSVNQKLTLAVAILTLLIAAIAGFKNEIINIISKTVTFKVFVKSNAIPLDKILITLEDSITHKLIDTDRTDNQGRVKFVNVPNGIYNYYFRYKDSLYKYDLKLLGNEDVTDIQDIATKADKVAESKEKKGFGKSKQDLPPNFEEQFVNKPNIEKDSRLYIKNKKIANPSHKNSTSGNVTPLPIDEFASINKQLPDTFKAPYAQPISMNSLSLSAFPMHDEPKIYVDTVDYFSDKYYSNKGGLSFSTDCKDCNWRIYLKGYAFDKAVTIANTRPYYLPKNGLFWEIFADKIYTFTIFDRTGSHFSYDIGVPPKGTARIFIKKKPFIK